MPCANSVRKSCIMGKIEITPSACILWALLLLVLPLRWLLSFFAAALIHECCHIAAVKLCGGTIGRITVGTAGAVMEVGPLSDSQELFCALAGPAGGLALLLFFRWIPCIAVFGALQSVYNLLPIFPLDGGRALRCCVKESVCRGVEYVCLGALAAGSILLKLGILPFLLILSLVLRKIPCKTCRHGLQ